VSSADEGERKSRTLPDLDREVGSPAAVNLTLTKEGRIPRGGEFLLVCGHVIRLTLRLRRVSCFGVLGYKELEGYNRTHVKIESA
jgi:hypothetical protein